MTKLVWKEDYSVGVPVLDGQHKKLFGIINTLVELGNVGSSSEEINEVLTSMTQYAHIHFDSEEKYMDSVGFPDLKQHEREHLEFTEKTTEFCFDVMDGDEEIPARIIDYLRHWWTDHILEQDMAYKRFVEGC